MDPSSSFEDARADFWDDDLLIAEAESLEKEGAHRPVEITATKASASTSTITKTGNEAKYVGHAAATASFNARRSEMGNVASTIIITPSATSNRHSPSAITYRRDRKRSSSPPLRTITSVSTAAPVAELRSDTPKAISLMTRTTTTTTRNSSSHGASSISSSSSSSSMVRLRSLGASAAAALPARSSMSPAPVTNSLGTAAGSTRGGNAMKAATTRERKLTPAEMRAKRIREALTGPSSESISDPRTSVQGIDGSTSDTMRTSDARVKEKEAVGSDRKPPIVAPPSPQQQLPSTSLNSKCENTTDMLKRETDASVASESPTSVASTSRSRRALAIARALEQGQDHQNQGREIKAETKPVTTATPPEIIVLDIDSSSEKSLEPKQEEKGMKPVQWPPTLIKADDCRRASERKVSKRPISVVKGDGTLMTRDEINKELLSTLNSSSNPICHSDLYTRTAHIVSAASGHQSSNRAGGTKHVIAGGSYMQVRSAKLMEQSRAVADDNQELKAGGGVGIGGRFAAELAADPQETEAGPPTLRSRIFAGCDFYVNGYTGTRIGDMELKKLLAVHGGNVRQLPSATVTHIVTGVLSASKAQKILDGATHGRKKKVVRVDWVLDSVKAGKRLGEAAYGVIANEGQPTLASSFGWAARKRAGLGSQDADK